MRYSLLFVAKDPIPCVIEHDENEIIEVVVVGV
jgi:hypothetical protein